MSTDLHTALRTSLGLAFAEARRESSGTVATYIPELGRVDPELFALAVATPDGHVEAVGDVPAEVTIQSVSKPFVYAAALERFGADAVHSRVGAEPTGDTFDSILRLDDRRRPHNPMVNAGALAVTGLFVGDGPDGMLRLLSAWAGRELGGIDEAVRASEAATGFRNRAIAHLLRHYRVVPETAEAVLDLYVRQCAVRVTVRDLAVMAATLAGGGRAPLGGGRVLAPSLVEPVLTVMATCGMYDHAGRFAVRVGMPGKSGVSGALLAVAPGRCGVAAISPRLDPRGNSVRGLAAIERLSERLGLHVFGRPFVRISRPDLPGGVLEEVRRATAALPEVAPAAYLPPEADDDDPLAFATCGVDGAEQAAGPAQRPFSLQAAGHPLLYAVVAHAVGSPAVHERVGREPAGHPFDSIRLGPEGRPANPFDNAGAIAVADLAPGKGRDDRVAWLRREIGRLTGREAPEVDPEVLRAEERSGERNRAIAALLEGLGLVSSAAAALEVYFASCALRVDVRDLARAAAVLARGGRALDGAAVLPAEVARDTLSLMYICGLHDESGRFAFEVGLPAKSGISGALWAVVPGRMGIAVRSPGVDDHGTSVRGRAGLRRLSRRLGLGVFATGAAVPLSGDTEESP